MHPILSSNHCQADYPLAACCLLLVPFFFRMIFRIILNWTSNFGSATTSPRRYCGLDLLLLTGSTSSSMSLLIPGPLASWLLSRIPISPIDQRSVISHHATGEVDGHRFSQHSEISLPLTLL
jgi:hypothetical protein